MSQRVARKVGGTASLAVVCAVTLLGNLDTQAVVPVLALYATDLGATVAMVGLIVGVYSLAHAPANILFGRVVDRVGRKRPLIAGLAADAISVLLYSVSKNPFHLLLVRISHGVGGALIGPSTMALIADYTSASKRGRTMALYGLSLAASVLMGFALSGVVVIRWGYSTLFYFLSSALVLATLLAFVIRDPKAVISEGGESYVRGGVERFTGLLKRRNLTASYSAIFAQYFTLGAVTALFPLYVKEYGMTAFHVSMLLTAYVVVFIALQFPSGLLSDRVGRRVPAVLGLGITTSAIYAIPFSQTFTGLIPLMMLYGAGYGLLFPAASALIVDDTTQEERGLATGVFHALLISGVAAGAPSMGLVAGVWGLEQGIRWSAAVTFTGMLAVFGLVRGKAD